MSASAAFQAIINGVCADALGAPLTSSGLWGHSRGAVLRSVARPRNRRPALALRQDV
ncbi:hypothetical protein ACFPA8_04715 [Streptomyces ovatisporus]|uniref:Uncharacterized protein n=1 Tax=Streptomyces ovatisporus TaxID=1128682 RepID=A0ABV9A761_9ACTN